MNKEYTYDAFISYRHTELDRAVADKLQKLLERYVPPSAVTGGKKPKKLRIFRDETELPTSSNLSDDIQNALEDSRFLIVLCSKTTKDSKWCMQEITQFKALHNGKTGNILAMLTEGEPAEVFPKELCTETREITDLNGQTHTEEVDIEPLAANVTAPTIKQSLKKLNREFLRIAAPLFGCGFDALYNRNQRRFVRRVVMISSALIAFFIAFAIYSGVMLVQIREQNAQITEKNEQITEQNTHITQQNTELEESNHIITEQNNRVLSLQSQYMAREALSLLETGNRRLSIYAARQALPSTLENPDRPYTDEAAYALTEALGAYTYTNSFFSSDAVFTLDSQVRAFVFSPDMESIAAVTSTHLYILRIADGAVLLDIPVYGNGLSDWTLRFSSDSSVIYTDALHDTLAAIDASTGDILWESDYSLFTINEGASVCIAMTGWFGKGFVEIDLISGQVNKEYEVQFNGYLISINISPCGKYFSITGSDEVVIADTDNGNIIFNATGSPEYSGNLYVQFGTDVVVIRQADYSDLFNVKQQFVFYELSNGEILSVYDTGFYPDMYFCDGNLLIATGYSGFEIYDYFNGTIVNSISLNGVESNFVLNGLLFTALNTGMINIYDAETGFFYENYSFNFPYGTQEITIKSGILAGRAGNEIHIQKRLYPPNFTDLETDMSRVVFIDDSYMLSSGILNDPINGDYSTLFVLWNISDNNDGAEMVSHIEIPGYRDYTFDEENMLIYCIADDVFSIISYENYELTVVNTVDAAGQQYVKITQAGTHVVYGKYGSGNVTINTGTSGSVSVETSLPYVSDVYEKDGSYVFCSYTSIEVYTEGESHILPITDIYVFHPVLNEYVYFENSELVFKNLFDESERRVDIVNYGRIASLFYAPDGETLFIASETQRLYALNVATQAFTEMEAEFIRTPQEAYLLGDKLVIRDASGYMTFWNQDNLKVIGKTSGVVRGISDDWMVISNGFNAGLVPVYSMPELLSIADEVLAGYVLPEKEKARYG